MSNVSETGSAPPTTKADLAEGLSQLRAELMAVLDTKADKADLERFATKADLERFATKADLERFATKADLERFATKADLEELRATFNEDMTRHINAMYERFRSDLKADFEARDAKRDANHAVTVATRMDLDAHRNDAEIHVRRRPKRPAGAKRRARR